MRPQPIGRALLQAGKELLEHDGMETAGFLAYTVLVAAFPFLIFLLSCASLMSGDQVAERAVAQGLALLPMQVRDVIVPVVQEVLSQPRPGLLTIGIAGAVWAAASGTDALRHALNAAYDVKEDRNWWKRKLGNIVLVLLAALAGLVVISGIVLLPVVLKFLSEHLGLRLPIETLFGLDVVRYLIIGALVVGLFVVIYTYVPAKAVRGWRAWPGAVLATLLWLLMAGGFSLYLYYFNSYSVTYGSLGGIVITLLFLQLSAAVFLLGAEFNGVLQLPNAKASKLP